MYKVKNKTKGLVKYRDNHSGKDVFIQPGKTIETNYPPIESSVFSIINIEKKEKTKLNKQEDKKW